MNGALGIDDDREIKYLEKKLPHWQLKSHMN
jgi:hypothetical protein